jgi:type I restriction enzyme, S subunit
MELKPGYKQTEVGVIPEDWEIKTLGELGQAIIGLTYKPEQVAHHGTLVLRSSNIQDCALTFDDNVYVVADIPCELMVQDGDVLICVRNGSRDLIGKTALLDERANSMTFGAFMAVFRSPIGSLINYHFQSSALKKQISAHLGATINQITNKSLRSFQVILPPTKRERDSMVEALQDMDGLIRDTNSLIQKKRQIKQAAMQELLTGKRRLPGFEGEWEVTSVKDVVSRHFCGPSPTCEERNIEGDHEWGVLKTTAITWEKGWSWKAHKLLPPSYWGKTEIELRKGDVLVTKAGPRHRVGVSAWVDNVPSRIIPSGKMIALRPIPKKAKPLMLAAAIASRETRIFLDQRTTGMAESQVNFENSVLLSAPISLPSIDEQSAISGICTDFDREIQDLAKKVSTLRRLKEGMMQQLLTGKIRLT